MNQVVTFGELMLRLAPEGNLRLVQADRFNATYGGAEANVAVSLCNFGVEATFVTRLPGHPLGTAALNALRRFGVDVRKIVRGGDRLGIYFLEAGASQRPSMVVYDRSGSSMQTANPEDFDWDDILKDAAWFHFTGITPALGDGPAAACFAACQRARALGIPVSCDLNYRKKLWSREKAGDVMTRLMQYVDVLIANEEDAGDVFGINARESSAQNGVLSREGYEEVAKKLKDRFGFRQVAITLRTSISASDNRWAAILLDGSACYASGEYDIRIVDRVGGGDSFAAGLIFANIKQYDPQRAVSFATAASCLKHSIPGDFNQVSVEEVLKLMEGDGSGRVNR